MKFKSKLLPHKTAPYYPDGNVIYLSVVSVLQILLFWLHFMVYETLGAAFGWEGWPLAVALFVLSFTYISASLLSSFSRNVFVRAYYKIAAVWFAFVAPLCGACFAFVVIEDMLPYVGIALAPSLAGTVSFGAAVIVTLYGMWNSVHIRTTNVSVALPNLPAFWRNKKVAFVADAHLGNVWGRRFAAKIVKKITSLDPAAVLIGGDLFDGVKCDTELLIKPFQKLQPPDGVYFVTGNHEYIRDTPVFMDAIQRAGITVLDNKKIDLHGLQLVGVDFKDSEKKEDMALLLRQLGIDEKQPSILLLHVPEHLEIPGQSGISLTLSGHTHAGQFWPISLVTRRIYKGFDYGLKRLGNMLVYTTSGLGTWVSPFRFGTKSEIVEIEFI